MIKQINPNEAKFYTDVKTYIEEKSHIDVKGLTKVISDKVELSPDAKNPEAKPVEQKPADEKPADQAPNAVLTINDTNKTVDPPITEKKGLDTYL